MNLASKYSNIENGKILDWGCGPGRITRHLPDILNDSKIYGTDYNQNTIEWCKNNINNVEFSKNEIDKNLNFKDDFFDLVIGISIFTHLSEKNHHFWIKELHRILEKDAIAIITTAGEVFKQQMTNDEVEKFDENQLVVRAKVKEGHRTYAAFQPPLFFEKIISNYFEILEHHSGELQSWGLEQDYWVLQAKK